MQDAATAHGEDFERVIEAGGIRAVGLDDRLEQINVVAPEVGFQLRFAGGHPIPIAAYGVDFAVMSKHPERLSERPLRKGICAIALVVNADGRLVIGMREVGVKFL